MIDLNNMIEINKVYIAFLTIIILLIYLVTIILVIYEFMFLNSRFFKLIRILLLVLIGGMTLLLIVGFMRTLPRNLVSLLITIFYGLFMHLSFI